MFRYSYAIPCRQSSGHERPQTHLGRKIGMRVRENDIVGGVELMGREVVGAGSERNNSLHQRNIKIATLRNTKAP